MDAKLKKMEAKLNPEEEDEQAAKARRRREQEERREKKKERKAIRGMAQKSLDPANWTAQLLDGTDSKFAGKVENEVEAKLAKAAVGLVTYDELKTMKETIEKEAEAKKMEEEKKRKAEEKIKSKEKKKAKATLSFNADEEDEA